MQSIAFLVACAACVGHTLRPSAVSAESQSSAPASRRQPSEEYLRGLQPFSERHLLGAKENDRRYSNPLSALGKLFLSLTPTAFFNPSGLGSHRSLSNSGHAGLCPQALQGQAHLGSCFLELHCLSHRAPKLVMSDDSGEQTPNATAEEALLLQRYLQLKTVLPESMPLPDETIQTLILKAEKLVAPVKFDEERISGEWQLVWQQNAKKATSSQKALAPLPQYSNFITDENGKKVFRNIVQLTKNRFSVVADVEYEDPILSSGDSPPNRLLSTIGSSTLQAKLFRRFGWKPLCIPLPIRGKGWLDITYLSDNMRISRGNRGSLFVHLRPTLLTKEAAEAAEATVALHA